MPDPEEDFIFKTYATIPDGSYCSLTMPTNPAGSKPSQYQPHDARLLRPTSDMLLTPCAMPRARGYHMEKMYRLSTIVRPPEEAK